MNSQARKKHGGNCVSLNEESPSEKTTYCKILTIWYSGRDKTIETEKNYQWSLCGRRWMGDSWICELIKSVTPLIDIWYF